MRLPRPRDLAQNWKLKLTALGLAVLLWALVSAEQTTTQWIPVRVEPRLRDPAYVLTGGPEPAEVRVAFTGPGRELWELALNRPVLVLPIGPVGQARSFVLDPQMVSVPEGLRVTPRDVRPAVVRLELQRLATRDVPVRPRVAPASLARYVVGDSVAVTPRTVRVTGPADAVERLEAVETRAFEIVPDPSADTTFVREAQLDTTGLRGLTVSRRDVRVSGRVDRRVERSFRGLPIAVPPGYAATPRAAEVIVQGPERTLRILLPLNLRVGVLPDSLPATVPVTGVDARPVVQGLPPGVGARLVPPSVRVTPAAVAPPPPAVVGGAARPDSSPRRRR